jgi:hypothetical protein
VNDRIAAKLGREDEISLRGIKYGEDDDARAGKRAHGHTQKSDAIAGNLRKPFARAAAQAPVQARVIAP